jgi:hypothetical protein
LTIDVKKRRKQNIKKMKFISLVLIINMTITGFYNYLYGQDAKIVWQEFRFALARGEIPANKIRPYYESLKEPILGFLREMQKAILPEQLEGNVEVFHVGDQLHFLLPVSLNGHTETYCFSFLIDGKDWYFRHLESISLRLDKITSFPASHFPDISDSQKAWMREEKYWTQMLQFYTYFSKSMKQDSILKYFRDGAGYVLEAKTWVPFVQEKKAFILYLCWEQSNLRGNNVILESINDSVSVVQIKPIYFRLYSQTAHFRMLIKENEYRQLFEYIWQDRAQNAGWNLRIEYPDGKTCRLYFFTR